jgi:glycosyltransferase involved in cell wall biosynthesis
VKTLGILADLPTASTGFAVVCKNLAEELSRYFRVIYFGRFGQEREFAPETTIIRDYMFEYVPCQGGVWDREMVVRLLKHYDDVDYVFSEDDWFSAHGMLGACLFWEKPFHLLSPIDSLPISPNAYLEIFTKCDKLYVPNSSYEIFNGRKRIVHPDMENIVYRQGEIFKSVNLPHGVDTGIFYQKKVAREPQFTFVWIGRPEERKAPARVILAFEKVCNKMDARLFIRTDWDTPNGIRLFNYIKRRDIPVTMDNMADVPHSEMCDVYNMGDVFVSTAKAGGCEMSILEAAACRLPSLVTDWTFMNENVVHGKSGFLVPVESKCHPPPYHNPLGKDRVWGNISIDALAQRMYWCYLNQQEVNHMGRWASEYVKEKYNWTTVANTLAEEIRE